jgi:hypothetical protein
MQIELGYLKVMHDATVKARELSKQAASYREGYFVLYGLVKMISSLSNEQFFKAMEDCGLPHPDLLVQQALEGNSSQEVTAPFTELLLKNPSPLLQRLREVMGKLTQ